MKRQMLTGMIGFVQCYISTSISGKGQTNSRVRIAFCCLPSKAQVLAAVYVAKIEVKVAHVAWFHENPLLILICSVHVYLGGFFPPSNEM